MDKVLLVSLKSPFLDSDKVFPPLGILYLKGLLDKHNIYAELEDEFDIDKIDKYQKFDYIALSCTTPQNKEAKLIARKIKKDFPLKKVIIGGPHASFYLNDCIDSVYDYVVVGDGEKALLDIVVNKSSEKILNRQLNTKEMNCLPLPFRKADFLKKYQYRLNNLATTTMITSRGCPFSCAFCEHAKTKVKYYGLEKIRAELSQVIELGYGAVMFFDDLFAVNQKRVEELCQIIKEFKIKFRCFGHVRCLTEKMAETLANAGCVETGVGMESGSQKILNTVKFPTPTIKQSYEYVKICHSYGIKVKAFFMLGLPGETMETIKETEEFIAISGIDDFDLAVYYPYRGTRIRDQIREYDIFLENTNKTLGYYKGKKGKAEISIRTSALTKEEIRNEKNRIFKKYKR